jgi:hypothetical protein
VLAVANRASDRPRSREHSASSGVSFFVVARPAGLSRRARPITVLHRFGAATASTSAGKSDFRWAMPSTEALNTTKSKPEAEPPLNTTAAKQPRSADRHLEPNRDRHRPGYMREYMRRWRAAAKQQMR